MNEGPLYTQSDSPTKAEADLVATGASPTGPPLSAKKRSYPHTGSACIDPALTV